MPSMGAMMGSAKKPAPLGGLHLQHLSSLWTGQHGHSSENRDAELCIQFLLLSGQQLCLQFRLALGFVTRSGGCFAS